MNTRVRRLPFRPFPLLAQRDVQTIVAAQVGAGRPPPSELLTVPLADGDALAMPVSTPPAWHESVPTVLILHGLCGCSRSPYSVRLARRLFRAGIRAVRVNLRGCGEGAGLAREPYHSGRSDDVRAVVEHFRARWPDSPLSAVGFSLSGNLVLKLTGELAEEGPAVLERVVAVCPPSDLAACSRKLSEPRNRMYDRHFADLLVRSARDRHRRFPQTPLPAFPSRLRLIEFDDVYTAPRCGFADAADYYRRASSLPYLERIRIETRILVADDDPIIDSSALLARVLPPHVRRYSTRRGGHLGFLGMPGDAGGYHWMDEVILRWLGVR